MDSTQLLVALTKANKLIKTLKNLMHQTPPQQDFEVQCDLVTPTEKEWVAKEKEWTTKDKEWIVKDQHLTMGEQEWKEQKAQYKAIEEEWSLI